MNNVEALFHYNRKLSQISRVSGSRSKMSKGDGYLRDIPQKLRKGHFGGSPGWVFPGSCFRGTPRILPGASLSRSP